jgi:hypothetical protein
VRSKVVRAMRELRSRYWDRTFFLRALALFALPIVCSSCRGSARSDGGGDGVAPQRWTSPSDAPPTASREVCDEKARKFRSLLAGVSRCDRAADCEASSALEFGKYNTTNCLSPLNPSRITPEVRAAASDYYDACLQNECAWEGSPASPSASNPAVAPTSPVPAR